MSMMGFNAAVRTLAVAALGLAAFVQPGAAQTYPSQTITFAVAFPAGGFADTIARLISTRMAERLKQSVVVENRGGAGGNLAAKTVASAPSDGYLVLVTTSALAINNTASKNKGYETSALRPVAFVAKAPDVLAVNASNPAKSLKEFIANAKQKSFTYGSAGAGTGPQIGAEYFFKDVAKVKYQHVPFAGGAPAITALLGGHIDSLVLTLPPVTPQIRDGKLRGLGVTSSKRVPAVPGVPTYAEEGFAGFDIGSWVGLFVPAKTPDAVVAKLNAEINAVMAEPVAQDRLAKGGYESMTMDVAAAERHFKTDIDTWAKMVNSVGFSN
jgi:tripartite-type tricarboxylate transporter receptor subunit TctC